MPDRDEEIVAGLRGIYEAFNRGDFDAAIAVAHPEIEYFPPGGQSSLRGADAVRAWMEPDAFESQRVEPLDFRVVGNKVLLRARTEFRGASSGIEADDLFWVVFTFDEAGFVTRAEIYLDHQEDEALEAAGLSK